MVSDPARRVVFATAGLAALVALLALGSLGIGPVRLSPPTVIDALLGGDVSPDTRQILLSGENPLLARADTTMQDSTMMRPRGRPQLNGLQLVVGLALGSPEFQRR